jgi:hypothetical protein
MRYSENKGHGREGGGGERPALRTFLPLLITLILLAPFQGASAAVQIESGTTQSLGNTMSHGSTSYVIYYTYPSSAQVGSNLTISLSLRVQAFTGVIEFTVGYEMRIQLFIGAQSQQVTISGPAGFNSSAFLYPGGTWGPINATFPLTAANTGLAVGQSTNATFSATLLDSVYVGAPYLIFETEPAMTGDGGTLLIQNDVASSTSSASSTSTTGPTSGQTLLPYALLASGAVLIAAAIFTPRGPRPPPSPTQK